MVLKFLMRKHFLTLQPSFGSLSLPLEMYYEKFRIRIENIMIETHDQALKKLCATPKKKFIKELFLV